MKDEVTAEWRKLLNEELNYLYSSRNFTRANKSRIMRWAGHVTRMGRREVHSGFWWRNLRGDHLEDPNVEGRIILRYFFRKWDGGMNCNDLAQCRVR
jgi:hypothetical protein